MMLDEQELQSLQRLLEKGAIEAFHPTNRGVRIQFLDGTILEFSANSDFSGEAFVEINECMGLVC